MYLYHEQADFKWFLFLRILCETVKDFIAKVGKAYEKSTENVDECDSMSLKVSLHHDKSLQLPLCPISLTLLPRMLQQCAMLNEKLDSLLQTLNAECQSLPSLPHCTPPIVEEEQEEDEEDEEEEEEEASEESLTELKGKLEEEETEKGGGSQQQLFKSREQLMLRANSLKKAVRQIIEQAVRGAAHQPPFIMIQLLSQAFNVR